MTDLNEASFAALLAEMATTRGLSSTPRCLLISVEGLAFARDLASRDPEFVHAVRREFPDLADALLGISS